MRNYNDYKFVKKLYADTKWKRFWYRVSLPFAWCYYYAKNNKSVILKALLIVAIIGVIAVSGYFILRACGFTTADDFIALRNKLGDSWVFWLVIALLQIFQVIFIPISNQIITVPLALIFQISDLWKVFLCSWLSIWFATLILYIIGRFGGKKVLGWLFKDQEQVEKCANFINRGWVFFPLGMLLPLPDDIVVILAGTGKMKFYFVAICSLITRAIDVACSVWGIGALTRVGWWGWLLLAIGICLLGVITYLFYKWDKKQREKLKYGSND